MRQTRRIVVSPRFTAPLQRARRRIW